jgi:DeoR/GlpR family transcriptional regulator of sugar metabolism
VKLPVQAPTPEELAGLNQRQRELLAYLQEHEAVNRGEYERMFEVNARTAKSDLQVLVTRGLVKRVGHARAISYRRAE